MVVCDRAEFGVRVQGPSHRREADLARARSGLRIRITAQLIDATTGVHQWAERYDRDAGEIFAVQDEIARSVAGAVEPHLLAAEGRRAAFLSPADLGAWELVARAQST